MSINVNGKKLVRKFRQGMGYLIGFMFIISLCLIGSDGNWFPLPNLLGLAIFWVVTQTLREG